MNPATSASFSSTSSSSSSWSNSLLSNIFGGPFGGLKMANSSSSSAPAAAAGVGYGGGPINKKKQFRGVMFKYGRKSIQVAFKTGDYSKHVIFIGGIMHGFLATEYLEPLASALEKEKRSLVQFLMSSSYGGYGTSSLEQDAMELDQLINFLQQKEDSVGIVLLGHGTGCQDIVNYMRTKSIYSKLVEAAILQAPVSDREYNATLPDTASLIVLASKMISEGRGSDLMPREANPDVPITASRYHSLCACDGDHDLFSSDLSENQLKQRLGHMSYIPCQIIFSMADQYVPDYVDKKALVDRLCRAMGGAEKVEIEWGNHVLSNRVQEAVQAIISFIQTMEPKGWDDPWS